jgi:hypothetical protein
MASNRANVDAVDRLQIPEQIIESPRVKCISEIEVPDRNRDKIEDQRQHN